MLICFYLYLHSGHPNSNNLYFATLVNIYCKLFFIMLNLLSINYLPQFLGTVGKFLPATTVEAFFALFENFFASIIHGFGMKSPVPFKNIKDFK